MSYIHTHADGSQTEYITPELWGVYVRGQDEWRAYESRKDAEVAAQAINDKICSLTKNLHSPHVWAIPDLWPWSAEDHASELAKNETAFPSSSSRE